MYLQESEQVLRARKNGQPLQTDTAPGREGEIARLDEPLQARTISFEFE